MYHNCDGIWYGSAHTVYVSHLVNIGLQHEIASANFGFDSVSGVETRLSGGAAKCLWPINWFNFGADTKAFVVTFPSALYSL